MTYGTIIFVLIIAAIALLAVVLRRQRSAERDGYDPGGALIDFGTAFPGAAVRDIVHTADGKATFLRLADGRTGFVEADGRRRALRLIEPASVRVETPVGDRELAVAFAPGAEQGATFVFARSEDAAEVSLWLCASLTAAGEGDGADERTGPAERNT